MMIDDFEVYYLLSRLQKSAETFETPLVIALSKIFLVGLYLLFGAIFILSMRYKI